MPNDCPRCGKHEINELSRMNPELEHRLFRCRRCGHLWSPILAGVGYEKSHATHEKSLQAAGR